MKNINNCNKISVFDFDSTLISTPLPDSGRIIYQKKTGKPWPHVGWWGQPESLDMDVFDMPVVSDVIADYKRETANPDVFVIMMTGRIKRLGDLVKKILDAKGLVFDAYYYNSGGRTDTVKINDMNKILGQHSNIEIVEQWDDRLSHIEIFEAWGKELCLSGRLKDYKINVVVSGHQDGNH